MQFEVEWPGLLKHQADIQAQTHQPHDSAGSSSTRAEFEQLLATSDVVSLHARVTPDTLGLIGAAELALMKPAALLVSALAAIQGFRV